MSGAALKRLSDLHARGEPIVMLTAYDYPSARIAEAGGVDVILVGDSAAMTVLGLSSTRGDFHRRTDHAHEGSPSRSDGCPGDR